MKSVANIGLGLAASKKITGGLDDNFRLFESNKKG